MKWEITITPVHVADLLAEGEQMPVYVHIIFGNGAVFLRYRTKLGRAA